MNHLRNRSVKFCWGVYLKIQRCFTVCVLVLMLAGTPIGTMQEWRARATGSNQTTLSTKSERPAVRRRVTPRHATSRHSMPRHATSRHARTEEQFVRIWGDQSGCKGIGEVKGSNPLILTHPSPPLPLSWTRSDFSLPPLVRWEKHIVCCVFSFDSLLHPPRFRVTFVILLLKNTWTRCDRGDSAGS